MLYIHIIRCIPRLLKNTVQLVFATSLLVSASCSESGIVVLGSGADNSAISATPDVGLALSSDATDARLAINDAAFDTPDWSEASHSNDANPDFEEVFDDTQVKRLDFVVSAERWQVMLDDMTQNYGEFGGRSTIANAFVFPPDETPSGLDGSLLLDSKPGLVLGMTPPRGPSTIEHINPAHKNPSIDLSEGDRLDVDRPGEVSAVGDNLDDAKFPQQANSEVALASERDPVFVPADVYYNDRQWYRVGIRFTGNSSLQSSWTSGNLKLSFKMDFDEFEDDYPQIDNQRFYGFEKFSLKSNYQDQSQLREKVAADIFRNAGVATSHTGFYALYLDYGDGPEYFGLYTLVEEVDDTVIGTQFSSDDGNLYKPEEGSADLVDGSFFAADFVKITHEDNDDWSDVIALFDALHADKDTIDAQTWRENLESVFDVDAFLKYLAVNGIIQNRDTYGRIANNYYLYNNPDSGKLTWIPSDNNEAFQDGQQGGALALDFANLDETAWPLIATLYADDVYRLRYNNYLFAVISDVFETSNVQATYDAYAELLAPYATSERAGFSSLNSPADFYTAIEALKVHASDRAEAVDSYLNSQ